MKRVCVIGCCGAGKSRFSTHFAEKTSLPIIHLDRLFWKENWIQEDRDIFDQKLNNILSKEQWIIDGHYSRTIERRVQKADTIFLFDFPTWICLYRMLKRFVQHHKHTRSDIAPGCNERFDWHFLKYVATFRQHKRPELLETLKNHAQHCKVIVFKRPSEVKAWLENFDVEN